MHLIRLIGLNLITSIFKLDKCFAMSKTQKAKKIIRCRKENDHFKLECVGENTKPLYQNGPRILKYEESCHRQLVSRARYW